MRAPTRALARCRRDLQFAGMLQSVGLACRPRAVPGARRVAAARVKRVEEGTALAGTAATESMDLVLFD